MSVRDLRFAKPLLLLVALIILSFANSLNAQSQHVLMVQEKLEETTEKLEQEDRKLHLQNLDSAAQLQLMKSEVLLAVKNRSEDGIDRSLVSKFWIGVQVEKAGSTSFSPKEVPDSKLNIDGGLRILSVTEGSAADEAGLEEGDVLLKFANKSMNSMNDLFAVVGETEENEADLVLIRKNELISLRITPQPRPEKSEGNEPSAGATGFWTIDEAYRNELKMKQLPAGYRLVIELVRGEDVMFKVENEGNTWQANEGAINQLPESIQPFAEKLAEQCEPLVQENQPRVWQAQLATEKQLGFQLAHPWQIHLQNTNDDRLKSIEQQLAELKEAIEQLSSERND